MVTIDPRMRARRLAVARAAGRKRLRGFVVLLAVMAAAALVVGATRTALLDVDEIVVSGGERTRVEDVVAAAGLATGDQLTDLDLAAARARIAALPWVLEVRSERSWSGTVEFEITERLPVAQVGSPSGWLVVDAHGRILEVRADRRPDVMAIDAAPGSHRPGGWIASEGLETIAVASNITAELTGVVDRVRRGDDGSLYLDLYHRGSVWLGSADELELKLRSVRMMIDGVNLSCLDVLDVRVPAVPVLTREVGCP